MFIVRTDEVAAVFDRLFAVAHCNGDPRLLQHRKIGTPVVRMAFLISSMVSRS